MLLQIKLDLAGLLDRRLCQEMLAAVLQPFMQEVEQVHTTIVKKIWRDFFLSCGATLLTMGLLLLLGWAVEMWKLYAMMNYMERFRRKNEETAAAAAMQLSTFDSAQEKCLLQQENVNNSAPPKNSQGETSSKKSPPKKKLVSELLG